MNTLIVSPNTADSNVLIKTLKQKGHQATLAQNGNDALNMLKKHKYNLVLIDDLLKDISFIDLISAVMLIDITIHIGLLTNMTASEIHEKAEGWGIIGSIPKPVDADGTDHFLGKLDRVIQLS